MIKERSRKTFKRTFVDKVYYEDWLHYFKEVVSYLEVRRTGYGNVAHCRIVFEESVNE